jgi:hypothetical protein
MPAVMVKISGEVDLYVDGVPGEHFFTKENQVGFVEDASRGPVFLRIDPHWRSQTQNHLVAGLHVLPDDLAEVLDLRDIEVALKLAIAGDQPPVVWQLQDEVTAALSRPPASKAAFANVGTEQPRKRGESVVPVVVAGHRINVWPFAGTVVAKGRRVRCH